MIDKRNTPINVRMTSRERNALNLIASIEGRNPSEMVRELVRESAQKRGVWLTTTNADPEISKRAATQPNLTQKGHSACETKTY